MMRYAAMLTALLLITWNAHARTIVDPRPDDGPIRIALLLDTSNSMDGLINQAKTHLWGVVNTFARADRGGRTPTLEVALFEYGNNGLPAHQGYIRQVLPFTSDLDTVSAALFALTTNGGSEHCGQVIDTAAATLAWGPDTGAYRAIFIAGNEPFTQGPVHYAQACQRAAGKGIIVNTIHCGAYDTGVSGMWRHGAELAGGAYLNIDQDRILKPIRAPQDDRLLQLNRDLNTTYLWYGVDKKAHARNQAAQDDNAATMAPQAIAERVAVKAGRMYDNRGRDLVDGVRTNTVKLEELSEKELPESMRGLSGNERAAYVAEQAQRRAALQAEIQELSAQRERYVAEQRRAEAEAGEDTLGDAMNKAIEQQLAARGYTVKP